MQVNNKLLLSLILAFSGYMFTFSQDSLCLSENYIRFYNSKNLNVLTKKLHHSPSVQQDKATFLIIGDSHIQGGYITNHIRDLFREEGYNTGRGMVFPYKFARKYGPVDIRFHSSALWNYHKWSNTNIVKSTPVGYSIYTTNKSFTLSFANKETTPNSAFSKITFFHSPSQFNLFTDYGTILKRGYIKEDIHYTEIVLTHPLDSCLLNFDIKDSISIFTIYAIHLENENEKISFNTLGINGISLQYYSKDIDWQPWIEFLQPDCIVIALGTNDVYSGKPDTSNFKKSAVRLIKSIKQSAPNSIIILATPNDHLIRRRYTNKYIPLLCNVLKQVAKEENCAVWDFFNIMGGSGSSREWHKQGLMFRDYVHLSKEGYKKYGELFYQAFVNSIQQNTLLKPITLE